MSLGEGESDYKSRMSQEETDRAVQSILTEDEKGSETLSRSTGQVADAEGSQGPARSETPENVQLMQVDSENILTEARQVPLPVTPQRSVFSLIRNYDPIMSQASPPSPMSVSSIGGTAVKETELKLEGATPTITRSLAEVVAGSKEGIQLPGGEIDKNKVVLDYLSSHEADSNDEKMEADDLDLGESSSKVPDKDMTQEEEDFLLAEPSIEGEKDMSRDSEVFEAREEEQDSSRKSEPITISTEVSQNTVVQGGLEEVETATSSTSTVVRDSSKGNLKEQVSQKESMVVEEKEKMEVDSEVGKQKGKGPKFKLPKKKSLKEVDKEKYKTPSELAREREKETEHIPPGDFDFEQYCNDYFKEVVDIHRELPIHSEGLNLLGLILMLTRHNIRVDMKQESGLICPQVPDDVILFNGRLTPLSNWHKGEIKQGTEVWNCVEQGMMYGKAILFKDTRQQINIKMASDPKKMQEYGELVENFDQEIWDRHKVKLVYDLVYEKFNCNLDYKVYLAATYPKYLAEATSSRTWAIGRYLTPTPDSYFSPGTGLISGIRRPDKNEEEKSGGFYLPPHSNLNKEHPLPEIKRLWVLSRDRPCGATRQKVYNSIKCFRDGLPPDPNLPIQLSEVTVRKYFDGSVSISVTDILTLIICPDGDEIYLAQKDASTSKVIKEAKNELRRYERFRDYVPRSDRWDPSHPDPLEGFRVICIDSPEQYCNIELYQNYEIRSDYYKYEYDPAHEYRAVVMRDNTPTYYTEEYINGYRRPEKISIAGVEENYDPLDGDQRDRMIRETYAIGQGAFLTAAQVTYKEEAENRKARVAEQADRARRALTVQRGRYNNGRRGRVIAVKSGLVGRGDLPHVKPEDFNEEEYDIRTDLITTHNVVLGGWDMSYHRKVTTEVLQDTSIGQQLALLRVYLEEMSNIPNITSIGHLLGFGGQQAYSKRTMKHMVIYEKGFKCPLAEARYHTLPPENKEFKIGDVIGCHCPIQYFESPLEYRVHFILYHTRKWAGKGYCQYIAESGQFCNHATDKNKDITTHVATVHKSITLQADEDRVYYVNLPSLPESLKTYPEVVHYKSKTSYNVYIQVWVNINPYIADTRKTEYRIPTKGTEEWRVCVKNKLYTYKEARQFIEGETVMKRSNSMESIASSTRSHSRSSRDEPMPSPRPPTPSTGQRKRGRSETPGAGMTPSKRRSESPETSNPGHSNPGHGQHSIKEEATQERQSRARERSNPTTSRREPSAHDTLHPNEYEDCPVPFHAPFWEWRMYCYKMGQRKKLPQKVIAQVVINHWKKARDTCIRQSNNDLISDHMTRQAQAYEQDIETLNILYDLRDYRAQDAVREYDEDESIVMSKAAYIKYYKSRMEAKFDFIFPHLYESLENLIRLRENFIMDYRKLAREIKTVLRCDVSLKELREEVMSDVSKEQNRLRVHRFRYKRGIKSVNWPEWEDHQRDGNIVVREGYVYRPAVYPIPRIYKAMVESCPEGWRRCHMSIITDEEKSILREESPEYVHGLKLAGVIQISEWPEMIMEMGDDPFSVKELCVRGFEGAITQYRAGIFRQFGELAGKVEVPQAALDRSGPTQSQETQSSYMEPDSEPQNFMQEDTVGYLQDYNPDVNMEVRQSYEQPQQQASNMPNPNVQPPPGIGLPMGGPPQMHNIDTLTFTGQPIPEGRPFNVTEAHWQGVVQSHAQQQTHTPFPAPFYAPRTQTVTQCVGLPTVENTPLEPTLARGSDITADVSVSQGDGSPLRFLRDNVNLVCVMESLQQHCTPLEVKDEGVSELRKEHYKEGKYNVGRPEPFERLLQKGDCLEVPVDNDQRRGRAQLAMSNYLRLHPDDIAIRNAYTILGATDMLNMALHCTTRRLQLEVAKSGYLESKVEECQKEKDRAEDTNCLVERANEKIKELEEELIREEGKVKTVIEERDNIRAQLDIAGADRDDYRMKYHDAMTSNTKHVDTNGRLGDENKRLRQKNKDLMEEVEMLKGQLKSLNQGVAVAEPMMVDAPSPSGGGAEAGPLSQQQNQVTLMDRLEEIGRCTPEFKQQVIQYLGAINPERMSNPNPDVSVRRFASMPTCIISMTPYKLYLDPLPTNKDQLDSWRDNMDDRMEKWSMNSIEGMRKHFK